MKKIQSDNYDINFGNPAYNFLGDFLNKSSYSKIFLITDNNCNELCVPHFLAHLPTEVPFEIIEIESGEENKNVQTCYSIWQFLSEAQADRNSVVITVGGGVVTDLGGFVAAVFKRGIDCINIPTSLLAMVDASVGGKTGIDLDGIKNQIGTFSMPKNLLIDVRFLKTLPANQMRSGLAEMYKHGLILDKAYWELLQNLGNLTTDDLEDLIYHSIQIKNEVVLQDPREKGIRKLLNFGHTLGHAVESYFLNSPDRESLLHGEAVAMGMILESYISFKKGMLSESDYISIKNSLSKIFEKVEMNMEEVEACLKWLKHDKKNTSGTLQFVLLNKIGEAVANQTVSNELIMNSFKEYLF